MRDGAFDRPGPGSDHRLRAIWRQAGEVPAAWRAHYGIPSSDPRYLDATEESMAVDLLMVAYRETQRRLAHGDGETVARDPDARRAMLRLKRNLSEISRVARGFLERARTLTGRPAAVRVITRTEDTAG